MKLSLLTTAAAALTLVSAAPTIEDAQVAAPAISSRTLGLLGGLFGWGSSGSYSNPWWTGSNKPYKMRAYCPDHPEVHNQYMNQRGDGTIGFEGSVDFQLYLDSGYWGGSSWGGHPMGYPGQDMCMTGKPGWKDMAPYGGPQKSSWGQYGRKYGGAGGYGSSSPSQWGSYGGWCISPLFPLLEWLDIFGLFSNKHYMQYQWGQGQSYGYDWICYSDGQGGHKVKYWDHKCPMDAGITNWWVIKIEIVKQSWWGKSGGY